MTTRPPDPTPCPLCGADPRCGIEAGEETCWCMQTTIPAALLATLPPGADAACVCADCVARWRADHPVDR